MKQPTTARGALIGAFASAFLGAVIAVPTVATADEGGVSFWLPGFFGSLAAAPQQPIYATVMRWDEQERRYVPQSGYSRTRCFFAPQALL